VSPHSPCTLKENETRQPSLLSYDACVQLPPSPAPSLHAIELSVMEGQHSSMSVKRPRLRVQVEIMGSQKI
jgi:hypothetical protein